MECQLSWYRGPSACNNSIFTRMKRYDGSITCRRLALVPPAKPHMQVFVHLSFRPPADYHGQPHGHAECTSVFGAAARWRPVATEPGQGHSLPGRHLLPATDQAAATMRQR